ncbi:pyruvate dehydrogenase E2 component (dihydrolipoamide acetyltransferase) [Crossiella equi]|uniref:Dihydrolipoamide acetyltransferase component of pyruvate dehydrogenase complex n=1 Tax=Crossiella equi TaxID=130796 RepID=A0ABS5AGF3_9PSEU|nr:dihydrolipoamide acetyltransferase family protein [Crossiella equi]MBP2475664.1 pyruvate dehydrogenase E2 component (dihydrolipoamide acetyltransferase) [Crossiella equi]
MPQFKQFPLPDTGEGLTEAEILTWHVKPGDTVTVNQIIVEIETAKAAVELPCPFAGVVTQLHVQPGETVEVGVPIITVDTDPGGEAAPAPAAEEAAAERIPTLVGYGPRTGTAKRRARKGAVPAAATAPAPVVAQPQPAPEPEPEPAAGGYVPLAKPPVRKLAKELGVDLRALNGSGRDGVITREDVEQAARNGSEPASVSTVDTSARERRVPVRGVRKATAVAMVGSAFTAPHVTEFLTVDVTPMMELRERLKKHPGYRDVKLTPLAFAARAVCLAIARTPDVNATWDEAANEIVYKSYVHLGIAAATPRGLVVPKVRGAEAMSLRELGQALEQLTATARDGKTPPGDMLGGTFTITNIGVFGIDTGTPIINPGESAILALGAIRDMPWVVDGQVVPRKVCQLALSFDHRVVDGQQGSQFLADVGALLADPAMAFVF